MNLSQHREEHKTGRQIRVEIFEALSKHDCLSTQQLALHVDQNVGTVANQLAWLFVRAAIERVAYVEDDYSVPGRLLYWNVHWGMTNHARHHLKKHFVDCRGCVIREMEAVALGRISLQKLAIGALHEPRPRTRMLGSGEA